MADTDGLSRDEQQALVLQALTSTVAARSPSRPSAPTDAPARMRLAYEATEEALRGYGMDVRIDGMRSKHRVAQILQFRAGEEGLGTTFNGVWQHWRQLPDAILVRGLLLLEDMKREGATRARKAGTAMVRDVSNAVLARALPPAQQPKPVTDAEIKEALHEVAEPVEAAATPAAPVVVEAIATEEAAMFAGLESGGAVKTTELSEEETIQVLMDAAGALQW